MNVRSNKTVDFDATPSRRGEDSLKWNRYASSGEDVIGAWIADMDFLTPAPVLDAVRDRLDGGALGYCDASEELQQVFRDRMQRLYGWRVDPDSIVTLPGVVPGLFGAVRSVGESGSGVITQTPNYHYCFGAAEYSDRRVLKVDHRLHNGRWEMDFDQLGKHCEKGASCFLLCNPHNPLGKVLGLKELEGIAEQCLRHGLMICSDEIHADLILDEDKRHIPIATLSPALAKQSITLVSPSKTFNLPGIGGLAFAVIPDARLRKTFEERIHGLRVYPGALSYAAGLAAYRDCDPWLVQLLDYLRVNRDFLESEVVLCEGISMAHIEATFLAWIDVSALGLENPFEYFLSHGVAFSEGESMGEPQYLRLNFACTRTILEEIIRRMRQAISSIS